MTAVAAVPTMMATMTTTTKKKKKTMATTTTTTTKKKKKTKKNEKMRRKILLLYKIMKLEILLPKRGKNKKNIKNVLLSNFNNMIVFLS